MKFEGEPKVKVADIAAAVKGYKLEAIEVKGLLKDGSIGDLKLKGKDDDVKKLDGKNVCVTGKADGDAIAVDKIEESK